jgi:tetratricopeptide (TPR) repeat protein
MDADRLVDEAVECLNNGDAEKAKGLLRQAATLAPLRTDIRELLQQAMVMQPSARVRRPTPRMEIPRHAAPAAAPHRSYLWVWLAVIAVLLLLLLVGGGAIFFYLYPRSFMGTVTPSGQTPGPTPAPSGSAPTPTPSAVGAAPTPAPSGATVPTEIKQVHDQAITMADQGDYRKAINMLEAAVGTDPAALATCGPDLAKWHYEVGREESRASSYGAAIEHFSRAVALEAGNASYQYWLGVTCFRRGRTSDKAQKTEDLKTATDALTKATELDPENLDALEALAKVHIARGNKVEARDCYDQIIRKAPDSGQARTAREELKNMGMKSRNARTE